MLDHTYSILLADRFELAVSSLFEVSQLIRKIFVNDPKINAIGFLERKKERLVYFT